MYKALVNDKSFEVESNQEEFKVNSKSINWDIISINKGSFHIILNHKSYRAEIVNLDLQEKKVVLKINGNKYDVDVKDKMDLLLERLGMDQLASAKVLDIKAPMPGLILDIMVKEGDSVQKGDQIMILEAMKMENVLKSPGDGEVKSIKVKTGDSVEKNQILIQF